MILAKEKGMKDKIECYKNALKRLQSSLEMKMASVHDKDKKNDLIIMQQNLVILINHVNKDFA
jgi:hypothetical protein